MPKLESIENAGKVDKALAALQNGESKNPGQAAKAFGAPLRIVYDRFNGRVLELAPINKTFLRRRRNCLSLV